MRTVDCSPLGVEKTIHVAFYSKGDKIQAPDNMAIVNAEYIINMEHLIFAAMSTFTAIDTHKKLLCKTAAQEFTFNLSPSNNIQESLRVFGDQSNRIAIVDLGQRQQGEFEQFCKQHVEREEIQDFQDILKDRDYVAFSAIFGNTANADTCLSMVAVKAIL